MAGGHTERSCTACNRSVYDLSVLTRRQTADLLDKHAGKVCGRIHYDERGKQIFAKERRPIERLVQISVLGASAVASAAASPAAPGCDLKVRVVDATGATVPKAIVTVSKAAGAEAPSSGTSNDQGEFSSRIAPGTYSLRVGSAGFAAFQQELSCKESESVSVKVPLQVGAALMGVVVEVKSERPLVLRKLRSLFSRL